MYNLVDEVIEEFVGRAYIKYGVEAFGMGGQMPFDVETISVDFCVYKKGTIESGRGLLIRLKEELTNIVNENIAIRPYLREYPFTTQRAVVGLRFCDRKGNSYKDNESIATVGTGKKEVVYYSKYGSDGRLEDALEESYEEAVRVVKSKKQYKTKK